MIMIRNSIAVIMTLFLVLSFKILLAQERDSSLVHELKLLKIQIDSLREQLSQSKDEIKEVRTAVSEVNEFDQLISSLEEGGAKEEAIPEDQRSRRRRLDRLLQAITERPGQLRFNGSASGIIQGNSELENRFSVGIGSFDMYASTAFGPHSLLFIDLQAKGGNSPDAFIPAFKSLNANTGSTRDPDDGIDRIDVLEAWAEFSAFRNVFHITAGKIDLSNYFDINALANDETSQFMSEAFVNSSAIPFPANAPGIRVRTEIPNYVFLQFGAVTVSGSGRNISKNVFRMGSLGLRVFANTEFEGNLRIYGYIHPEVDKSYGYGLSFDKSLIRSLALYVRWNKNEPKLADWNGLESAWSSGVRFLKIILNRYFIIGIAYGVTKPQDKSLQKEELCEVYARMQLNEWTYLSPHIQYIRDAGGVKSQNWLWGVRTQFEF